MATMDGPLAHFVHSSSVIRSLTEDATANALATALATLPYDASDANRWMSALSTIPPPPATPASPSFRSVFSLFTGSYYPVLDEFDAADLAGAWHVAHYLHTPDHHCFAVEETLVQRFAAGVLSAVTTTAAAGSGAATAAPGAAGSKRKRHGGPPDWSAALSASPGELWERLERRWLALLSATRGSPRRDAAKHGGCG